MASALQKAQTREDRVHESRKVKVTILGSEWGPSNLGLSTINRELAIQLAKFPEVEITFFLPKCSEEDRKIALEHKVKIVEATPLPGFEQLDWLCFPPKDLQIDIIVGHGVKLGKQAQVIKDLKTCKWFQVVHTDPEELGMFKNVSKPISKGEEKHKTEVELCKMADHVVGVGPKLSEAFRSYLCGCNKDGNVFEFTPGVFEEFKTVRQAPNQRQQRNVLVFGSGDVNDFELKGFDIAGKAIAALQDTRLTFVGAPDGKHEEIAKRLIECGVPASRLRVRGFAQDRKSLKRLFQEVDLAVMPSRTGGFGLTGLEAMSAGLPVLVSSNSGFGEALCSVTFGSASVIESEDPTVWTAAIKKIWSKDGKCRLMEAVTLRDNYGMEYDWTKQIKELVDRMISLTHEDSRKARSSLDTKCNASQRMEGMSEDHEVPREIKARGSEAKLAYQNALRTGKVKVYRARIILVGQDRAGKTSLKKSFLGLPFDPEEDSTDGIEVDPSKFEVHIDHVKNWKRTDEELSVSQFAFDLANMAAREIQEREKDKEDNEEGGDEYEKEEEKQKKEESKLDQDLNTNKQTKMGQFGFDDSGEPWLLKPTVGNSRVNQDTSRSGRKETGALIELNIDPTLPPEEFTDHLDQLLNGLNLQSDATTVEHHMTLDLWDFAGQQLYYASYPVFLSSRAVYMLVYNLSKGLDDPAQPCFKLRDRNIPLRNPNKETNVEKLLSWLVTIGSICSEPEMSKNKNAIKQLPYCRPPVFIVGTHADKRRQKEIKKIESQIQRELSGNGQHLIRPIFAVDNTKGASDRGIAALQKRMIEVLKQEPYMGEEVPIRWFNFEKVVKALVAEKLYHLNVEQVQTIIQKHCFIENKDEVAIMLNFYHDLGVIVKHGNTVVLQAKWLIKLFQQLITVRCFDDMEPRHCELWKEMKKTGVLSMELVDDVFSEFCRQGVIKDDILKMMEKFGLIVQFAPSPTEEKYFVPCQLWSPPDSLCKMEPSPADPCPLYLHFSRGYVPHGLYLQLVSRCTKWCSESGFKKPPKLFDGASLFFIGKELTHYMMLVCKKRFIRTVLLRVERNDGSLSEPVIAREVPTLVRTFLNETMQNLRETLSGLKNVAYKLCVECPYCLKMEKLCDNHGQFPCCDERCMCFLEVAPDGSFDYCSNSLCREILSLPELERWFSSSSKDSSIKGTFCTSEEEVETRTVSEQKLASSTFQRLKRKRDQDTSDEEVRKPTKSKKTFRQHFKRKKDKGTSEEEVKKRSVSSKKFRHLLNRKKDASAHKVETHTVSKKRFRQLLKRKKDKVKKGIPSNDELEHLSLEIAQWEKLGRRLNFKNSELKAFHKENEEWSEKAFAMLLKWKEKNGSSATYRCLRKALCHEFVNRKDLAEKFCRG